MKLDLRPTSSKRKGHPPFQSEPLLGGRWPRLWGDPRVQQGLRGGRQERRPQRNRERRPQRNRQRRPPKNRERRPPKTGREDPQKTGREDPKKTGRGDPKETGGREDPREMRSCCPTLIAQPEGDTTGSRSLTAGLGVLGVSTHSGHSLRVEDSAMSLLPRG